jgi:hypothetical protein
MVAKYGERWWGGGEARLVLQVMVYMVRIVYRKSRL